MSFESSGGWVNLVLKTPTPGLWSRKPSRGQLKLHVDSDFSEGCRVSSEVDGVSEYSEKWVGEARRGLRQKLKLWMPKGKERKSNLYDPPQGYYFMWIVF